MVVQQIRLYRIIFFFFFLNTRWHVENDISSVVVKAMTAEAKAKAKAIVSESKAKATASEAEVKAKDLPPRPRPVLNFKSWNYILIKHDIT